MNSASLCSLAGRYENPIPPRCLAPTDCPNISALHSNLYHQFVSSRNCHAWTCPLPPPSPDPALLMAFQYTCLFRRRGGGGGAGEKKIPSKPGNQRTQQEPFLAYTKILPGCFFSHSLLPKRVYHRLRVWKVCFVFIVLILLPFYV